MSFQLIIGLGNPGSNYVRTRHNAGWWMLDELARVYQGVFSSKKNLRCDLASVTIAGQSCRLLRSHDYMNDAGLCAAAVSRFFDIRPEHILVIHDELDLPVGAVRLKRGGGHGGHNGLRHIIQQLGTQDFARLRLGIGHPGHASAVTPYVLRAPGKDDEAALLGAIDAAMRVMPDLIGGQWDAAVRQLHTFVGNQ